MKKRKVRYYGRYEYDPFRTTLCNNKILCYQEDIIAILKRQYVPCVLIGYELSSQYA